MKKDTIILIIIVSIMFLIVGALIFTIKANNKRDKLVQANSKVVKFSSKTNTENEEQLDVNEKEKENNEFNMDQVNENNPVATIDVKNFGTMTIELLPEIAPNTVANFTTLANNGFYDGLKFHRIIDGFMIQGGDRKGNGTGSARVTDLLNNGDESEYKIKAEFNTDKLSHQKGVISMARSQNPNSASSQFFICDGNANYLDGQYASFGKLIDGQDVLDNISKVDVINVSGEKSTPVEDVVIESIRVDTKDNNISVPEYIK